MKEIDGVKLIDRDFKILKKLEEKSGFNPSYSNALNDYMDIGFHSYENKIRALIITEYSFDNLPEEIFDLLDLDELAIVGIKSVNLGGIEKLSLLETLTIRSCEMVHLPESIGLLKNLKELEISYSNLNLIPKTIGDLSSLEKLDLE